MHGAVHYMLQSRSHIANEGRQGNLEAIEDGVDAGIGVATARGCVMRFAACMFECLIGNRRTDGIGIGIFVAENIYGLRTHEGDKVI